jgi:4a-hydroxytetrahydrobiopterin dehydratase
MNYIDERCKPLSGAEHRLSKEFVLNALGGLKGWSLQDNELVRVFHFANYYQTMAFVNALAYMAHNQDHHPDLAVHYNRVVVRFSTHDVGGISRNDLICASKAQALFDAQ